MCAVLINPGEAWQACIAQLLVTGSLAPSLSRASQRTDAPRKTKNRFIPHLHLGSNQTQCRGWFDVKVVSRGERGKTNALPSASCADCERGGGVELTISDLSFFWW